MRTIIQDFPRIYGEAVNGSVFGQPNGSIARPPQGIPSSITLSGTGKLTYVETSGDQAIYTLSGVDVSVVFPSGYYYIDWIVLNAGEDVVAMYSGTGVDLPSPVNGNSANLPGDGDSLTLKVSAYVRNSAVPIATDSITITAEVSS